MNLYLVAEMDLELLDQVYVVSAENEDQAVEIGMKQFAEKDSKENYFREYVLNDLTLSEIEKLLADRRDLQYKSDEWFEYINLRLCQIGEWATFTVKEVEIIKKENDEIS